MSYSMQVLAACMIPCAILALGCVIAVVIGLIKLYRDDI